MNFQPKTRMLNNVMTKARFALAVLLLGGTLDAAAAGNEPANQQIVSREYLKPAGSRTFAIE